MRMIAPFCIAFALLCAGAYDVFKQKQMTRALDEIVRFVFFIKNELHYSRSDFETLSEMAQKQNFGCIKFDNGNIKTDAFCGEKVGREFTGFVSLIGTTDVDGQIALCDEYLRRFSEMAQENRQKEKSRIQVNAALSVLGAVCVIILSL